MPFGAPADPFSTMRFACLLVWLFACLASWDHTEMGSKSWNLGVLGGSRGGPGGFPGGPWGALGASWTKTFGILRIIQKPIENQ